MSRRDGTEQRHPTSAACKRGDGPKQAVTLSAIAVAVAALFPPTSGLGQQPAEPSRPGVEEITVTGSRIVRTGMQTPTPVTAVSMQELEKMEPGNMVDALSQLPQFLNNTTATNRSNFLTAAGGAFLNVRGLGTDRTLVLLNGRRVPPSDRNSSVDTNLFPETLVERVEVVTGGASAAYGADALSGVVNFILNTRYEGMDAKVQGGQTAYGDGDNWEASLTGGFELAERMHLTFAVEGFHQDQVSGQVAALDDRDWFGRWGYVTNPAFRASDPRGTNPQRLVLPNVHSTQFTPGGKINQPGFAFDQYTFIEDGTMLRPFVAGSPAVFNTGTLSTSGGPEFDVANRAERAILSSEVDRTNAFLNLDFDLNDRTTAFVRAMTGQNYAYMHDVNGGLGPSLMGIWQARIFRDNAFLPETVRQAMDTQALASFRMDKSGALAGRNNYQDDYTDGTEVIQRMVSAGFERELANDWSLTGFVQYGKSDKEALLDNVLRVDREFLAMDAVEVYEDRRDLDGDGLPDLIADADRGTGDIICNVQRFNPTVEQLEQSVAHVRVPSTTGPVGIASPVGLDNTIEDCVPLNIFGWGNVSPEAAAYVVSDKGAKSEVEQRFAEFTLSGDVFENRGAGALAFTVGATYREEQMSQVELPLDIAPLGPPQNVDGTSAANGFMDLGIRGIPPGFTGGSPNLHQFANLLTFAGKFDVWELFGETYVPLSQNVGLSLAGRHSEYSRAGGIDTWKVGLDAQVTPALRLRGTVSHDAREATFSEQFDLNGGGGTVNDPAFGGSSFAITVNQGGNPDLRPEEADTYTVGFVFQPQGVDGLAFSVDYYAIDLSETIGNLGTQRIVDDCFNDQVPQACALVERDPATNVITRVSNILVNIDDAKVAGTDLELTYATDIDWLEAQSENLSFRFLAGVLSENSSTPLGGQPLDLAGSTQFPELTTTATVNYRVGPWTAYVQHRYIEGTKVNASWTEGVDVDRLWIDSVDYTNLGITYTRDGANGTWEFFGNVVNAFDEHPPAIPTDVGRGIAGSTGYVQHNAIALGRRFVIGARLRL